MGPSPKLASPRPRLVPPPPPVGAPLFTVHLIDNMYPFTQIMGYNRGFLRTGSTRMVQMTCSRARKSQLSFVTDFSCLTTCMFSHYLAHSFLLTVYKFYICRVFGVSAADFVNGCLAFGQIVSWNDG